jgi:hypothetical protein
MVTSARHRALARLLHEAPRIDPNLASLHVQIVLYRERAAALFRRLVELEAQGNDNLAPFRLALIRCSERVEELAAIVDAPGARHAAFDFADAPTIPRRR